LLLIIALQLSNLIDIITTWKCIKEGFYEINPFMRIIQKTGWRHYLFLKSSVCIIVSIPYFFDFGKTTYWISVIVFGISIFLFCSLINIINLFLFKIGKYHYLNKLLFYIKHKMNKSKNLVFIAALFILIGLIGPWIKFFQYSENIGYFFKMSPFHLIINIVPNNLSAPQKKDFILFYRLDSTFLGFIILVGIFIVTTSNIKNNLKWRWIGLALISLSTILFPSILPIIFTSSSVGWGIIMEITGILIILLNTILEYIKEKYNFGYPKLFGRKK
jgi:hypothetical protein